jgi:hypothetical protein
VPVLSAISVVFMYLYRKTWKDAPRAPGRGPGGPGATSAGGAAGTSSKPPEPAPLAAPQS